MPRYDYVCKRCKANTVRIVPMSERNSQVCECGNPLTRVFSMPAVKVYPDQSQFMPSSEDEKKAWKEQGVGRRWV